MKLSTCIEPFDKMRDIKKVLTCLKNAGFEAYDYSMFDSCKNLNVIDDDNYIEKTHKILHIAQEIGIECNQSHAPFPTWLIGKDEYNEVMFKRIIRALHITSILGGKVCVVHPCNDASAEENASFYKKLLPYAQKYNVKIGVENMWNWNKKPVRAACSHHDDFAKHMELLDEEWFVAHVDIGHAEMQTLNTSACQMLKVLNKRVISLHIHDTDCYHDNHAIPFTMKINYEEICKTLKEINYSGDITLEVMHFNNVPTCLYPSLLKFMRDGANYIRDLIINK